MLCMNDLLEEKNAREAILLHRSQRGSDEIMIGADGGHLIDY